MTHMLSESMHEFLSCIFMMCIHACGTYEYKGKTYYTTLYMLTWHASSSVCMYVYMNSFYMYLYMIYFTTLHMTDSAENATHPTSTKSRSSNSSVQIQIRPKSHYEFGPQDTGNSEFLDLAEFGGVAISVETVLWNLFIYDIPHLLVCTYIWTPFICMYIW